MEKCDIAIIGAGPGGCACALALQGCGLRVILIDKDTFPRDKICGDAIPGPAFKAMDSLHPEWGRAMRNFANKTEIRTSKIYTPGGKTISLDWVTYSYNSKRIHFDEFLAELVFSKTDTKFLQKRLMHIFREKDGLLCHFDDDAVVKATIVIGCDGANSMVKRRLNPAPAKPAVVAVRAYYQGVSGITENENSFHFFKRFPGYFWIFPLPDNLVNVGFGAARKNGHPDLNLRETLDEILSTMPGVASRFSNAIAVEPTKGFALPVWDGDRPISGERFMLGGDAASLVDPLQGHGIDKAMWSGILAAQHAIRSFKIADFSADALRDYDRDVYGRMGGAFKKNTMIMHLLMEFPWLFHLAASLGQHRKLVRWAANKLKI